MKEKSISMIDSFTEHTLTDMIDHFRNYKIIIMDMMEYFRNYVSTDDRDYLIDHIYYRIC